MFFQRFNKGITILYFLVMFSCTSLLKPEKKIQQNNTLLAPDYSELQFWAAHPDKKDLADIVPVNTDFIDKQSLAEGDVFFIHPTTHLKRNYWNGDLTNKELNDRTDEGTMKYQASVFNECCRVYAPRYRPMSLS